MIVLNCTKVLGGEIIVREACCDLTIKDAALVSIAAIILPGTPQTASGGPACVCACPRLPLGGAGLRPGVRSWESGGIRVAQGLEVGKRPGHSMAPGVPLSLTGAWKLFLLEAVFQVTLGPSPAHPKP